MARGTRDPAGNVSALTRSSTFSAGADYIQLRNRRRWRDPVPDDRDVRPNAQTALGLASPFRGDGRAARADPSNFANHRSAHSCSISQPRHRNRSSRTHFRHSRMDCHHRHKGNRRGSRMDCRRRNNEDPHTRRNSTDCMGGSQDNQSRSSRYDMGEHHNNPPRTPSKKTSRRERSRLPPKPGKIASASESGKDGKHAKEGESEKQ